MSRMFNEHLESIGYFDIQGDQDELDWREITPGDGKKNKPLYICRKGIPATIRKNYDEDGEFYEMYPRKRHKGDAHGHLNVRYTDTNGKHREVYIHRMVAMEYIPNPKGYSNVLHWDDDPTNNNVENLRWGTQRMNWEDSVRNGTAYIPTDEDRRKGNEGKMIPVRAINMDTGEELYFESATDAARKLGLQQANVWKVLNGQRKHTMRWLFEKTDD